MKRRFKDFYGCGASITPTSAGEFRLVIRTQGGGKVADKQYPTERGALCAMRRSGDAWKEITA